MAEVGDVERKKDYIKQREMTTKRQIKKMKTMKEASSESQSDRL